MGMLDILKAIFKGFLNKNSFVLLLSGTVLIMLGAVSQVTFGDFSIPQIDTWGRIVLISVGLLLIVLGAYFAILDYRSKSTEDGDTSTTSETGTVTYRSKIRLVHCATRNALHSHPWNYEHKGSSKEQQVTCYGGSDDYDFWIVKGPHGKPEFYKKGQPIRNGDIVRLEHVNTRKNLNSNRLYLSPVSRQQEVCAFGKDGIGNTSDNWKVDFTEGGSWNDGYTVRLIHVETGVALHSHSIDHSSVPQNYLLGQQEVTGYAERNKDDLWMAMIIHRAS